MDVEDELRALHEWALDDLKSVSKRATEFGKFFFAVSAGSFGAVPFFGKEVSLLNLIQLSGLGLIGASAFIAIRMLEPPNFKITDATEYSAEHEKFAGRIRRQRKIWLAFWLTGFLLFIFGLTSSFERKFCFVV